MFQTCLEDQLYAYRNYQYLLKTFVDPVSFATSPVTKYSAPILNEADSLMKILGIEFVMGSAAETVAAQLNSIFSI